MAKSAKPNIATVLLAGVLAWVIPGAGHVYLGRTLRGVIICVCLNALFWTGMAIGGVFTIDPVSERWWFAAQFCGGVSALGGWYRQDAQRKAITSSFPDHINSPTPPKPAFDGDERPAEWRQAYANAVAERRLALTYPGSTVARAYTGIAGMLNLMCIFDAVMLALLGRFGEPPPAADEEQEEETA